MKRLLLVMTLSAGGGGLMVMSGAHAAAFTPRPSEVAAVPSSPLRLASPDEGYVQQVVSGERSFAMKLHDWLATHFNRPIYVGPGGARQLVSAREELLDVAGETAASASPADAGRPAYKQRLQGHVLRLSKADLEKLVYLVGRSSGAGLVRGGEELLDVAAETRATAPGAGTDVEALNRMPKILSLQKWMSISKQTAYFAADKETAGLVVAPVVTGGLLTSGTYSGETILDLKNVGSAQ